MPSHILTLVHPFTAASGNSEAHCTSDVKHFAKHRSAYVVLQHKFANGLQSHFREMNSHTKPEKLFRHIPASQLRSAHGGRRQPHGAAQSR